jgi:hypothetical protein
VMVLSSAFVALAGMLILNRLPRYHHPVFESDQFKRFSTDAFFVSILADDPHFDKKKTVDFLTSLGGQNIELLEEEEEQNNKEAKS